MGRAEKWTHAAVMTEASKYSSRSAFAKGSPTAYQKAWRENWLDDTGLPATKWTFEKVKAEAESYSTIREFRQGSPDAYRAAFDKGWLTEFGF